MRREKPDMEKDQDLGASGTLGLAWGNDRGFCYVTYERVIYLEYLQEGISGIELRV
jgi:hypothetical protein